MEPRALLLRGPCPKVFGFDFMVDENFRVWLIEALAKGLAGMSLLGSGGGGLTLESMSI